MTGFNQIHYTLTSENLTGTNRNDHFCHDDDPYNNLLVKGLGGNDYYWDSKGNDTFYGGEGDDTVENTQCYATDERGDNKFYGGAGNDQLGSGNGKDTLYGDAGSDWLDGGFSSDILYGGLGNDIMWGGLSGNDTLYGQGGNDLISGQGNDDYLLGGKGNDHIWSDQGLDTLIGVESKDSQPGKGERDTLSGYEYDQVRDIFVLGDAGKVYYNDGNNTTPGKGDYALIQYFDPSTDVIQLKGTSSEYNLRKSPTGMPAGRAIFLETGTVDELIGIVQLQAGSTNFSLTASCFKFV